MDDLGGFSHIFGNTHVLSLLDFGNLSGAFAVKLQVGTTLVNLVILDMGEITLKNEGNVGNPMVGVFFVFFSSNFSPWKTRRKIRVSRRFFRLRWCQKRWKPKTTNPTRRMGPIRGVGVLVR